MHLSSLDLSRQEAMTPSSAAGFESDPADYLAGLRAVLDPASSEASSGTSAGLCLRPDECCSCSANLSG